MGSIRSILFSAILLIVGAVTPSCGPGQLFGPTLTPTPTSTPIHTLTPTRTLTPTSTSTPTPGIGVPRTAGDWTVTVLDAFLIEKIVHQELMRARIDTWSPKPGYAFLVVHVKARLAPTAQRTFFTPNTYVLSDTNGNSYEVSGQRYMNAGVTVGDEDAVRFAGEMYTFSMTGCDPGETIETGLVFIVGQDTLAAEFQLSLNQYPVAPIRLESVAPTETSAPSATPAPTGTSTPSDTPNPTPALFVLPDVVQATVLHPDVTYFDPFDEPLDGAAPPGWISCNDDTIWQTSDGILQITSQQTAEWGTLYYFDETSIVPGSGVFMLFRYEGTQGTFTLGMDHNTHGACAEWDATFCSFAMEQLEDSFNIHTIMEATQQNGAFQGTMLLTENTWYGIVFGYDSADTYFMTIWNQANPDQKLVYRSKYPSFPDSYVFISWLSKQRIMYLDNFTIFRFDALP